MLNENDLRYSTWINGRTHTIEITHLPSGKRAELSTILKNDKKDDERRMKNRENALRQLTIAVNL